MNFRKHEAILGAHASLSSTWEVKAGGSGVEGHSQLHSELRLALKKRKQNKTSKAGKQSSNNKKTQPLPPYVCVCVHTYVAGSAGDVALR